MTMVLFIGKPPSLEGESSEFAGKWDVVMKEKRAAPKTRFAWPARSRNRASWPYTETRSKSESC